MSRTLDDREGLSPPPPTAAQLAELWEDEDDDEVEYEPASENSEDTFGTEDNESEENEFLGIWVMSATVESGTDIARCR